MVKLEKANAGKTVNIECDCGCGIIQIAYWNDEDPDWNMVTMEYYPLGFYAYQRVWRKKLKAIWKILTGKYYSLFDVNIEKKEFLEKIQELLDAEEN